MTNESNDGNQLKSEPSPTTPTSGQVLDASYQAEKHFSFHAEVAPHVKMMGGFHRVQQELSTGPHAIDPHYSIFGRARCARTGYVR